MQQNPAIVTLLMVLIGSSVLHAAEGPVYDVAIDEVITLYTATPSSSSTPGFKPHINFPWLTQRADGSLLSWWTVGQTQSGTQFGLGAESFDGGQTWTTPSSSYPWSPPMVQIAPAGQVSRGFVLNVPQQAPFTSFSQGRYTSSDGGHTWQPGTAFYDTGGVAYTNLYQNPGHVIDTGSSLLLTAFGQRPGVSTFESVLFASDDGGANWTRRSTIAQHVAGPNASMGQEGPNESDIIQLDNGDLLAVYRTGQPFPNDDLNAVLPSIFRSLSSDGGHTWSTPKMLGVMGSYPHLNKLDDGSVAMTYGRYGAKVMFADPTGTRWSFPTVIHNESSSGYVRMHERADGKYVFAYDASSFYPASITSPPPGYVYANDELAHMNVAILDIQRSNAVEPFGWAIEYHGDLTPDTAPYGWTRSQAGAISAFLWADLGQDYLRIDTGASGASNALHYSLDGEDPASAWAAMSFSAGVVLETRARVGLSGTAPSSASIMLGDGENGYIILELTGDRVSLEGLGGNAGQVDHTAAGHPGFSTLDWHVYRLIIAPDAAAGGLVRASLFMDGESDPILAQLLMPSDLDQLLMGDITSTNNGILDVDFLRFATVPEPASLAVLTCAVAMIAGRRGGRRQR